MILYSYFAFSSKCIIIAMVNYTHTHTHTHTPEGPMEIGNMRLNSIASVRSLPESGDFMSCFLMRSFISA